MKFRLILVFATLCFMIVSGFYYKQKGITSMSFDLDGDGISEKIGLRPYLGLPGEEKTEVYLNGSLQPTFTLFGFLESVLTHNIDNSKYKVLELQLASGHSINSLLYRYKDGVLKRIPVSTEKAPYFMGIVARNTPEFKDTDGDGIMEMFVYYRYFPPEKRRKVELYKFNGVEFEKQKQYEESTPVIYL